MKSLICHIYLQVRRRTTYVSILVGLVLVTYIRLSAWRSDDGGLVKTKNQIWFTQLKNRLTQ